MLPRGTVLNAACETGRYSTMLTGRGHDVIGVDQSGAMLEIARSKLPLADFRVGDLTALPLPGRSVYAVVCALALTNVPDVATAMREFARVLRPGGRLIISDVHAFLVMLGWQAQFPAPDGAGGEGPRRGSCACTALWLRSTPARRPRPVCGCAASPSRRSLSRP